MNLSITIGKVQFNNPVTVASGTFGLVEKYLNISDVRKLGAIVPKTITLYAQEGNPPARIVETPAGMLNAIGISNLGADKFIEEKMPLLRKIGVPVIISVSAKTDEQFVELVQKFSCINDVKAIELNLSCPNLQKKTLVAQDAKATERVVSKVKKVSDIPIIAKLTPNVTDISEIAVAAQNGGADAVSLINTLAAMAIDINTRKPILGNVTGGLSGPAIRPVAVRMVYQVAQKVSVPVIAMGGIMSSGDALEFIIAGASMVAVGTANFINPKAPIEVLDGIKKYMKKNKINDIKDIIGSIEV